MSEELERLDDPARAVLDLRRVHQRLTVLNRQGLAVEALLDRVTAYDDGETVDVRLRLLGPWMVREQERYDEMFDGADVPRQDVPVPGRAEGTRPAG